MKNLILAIFLSLFILTACNPTPTPEPTLTPTPTPQTQAIVLQNQQNTPIPTSTNTPIPIDTQDPTQTHTVTATTTPTLIDQIKGNGGLIVTLGEKVPSPWWDAIPAFSPDGKLIALSSDRVRLWNVQTHELIHEFIRPHSNCHTENAVFSFNGSLFATSIYCLSDSRATGHVLVWDTNSGILLHDWEQSFSKNTSELDGISNSRPATGIAFLPKSSILAFANGNTIEIKDIQQHHETTVLNLGDDMIASDIAISENGNHLYAFMDFSYFKPPNKIGQKYALQIWDFNEKRLEEEITFPEPGDTGSFGGHHDAKMELFGNLLIHTDYINKTFRVTNLETDSTNNLHYGGDVETYISQDTNYVIYYQCRLQSLGLWNTRNNQILDVIRIKALNKDFDAHWCYRPHTTIFSPDNTTLAIAHEERVSLWDTSEYINLREANIPE
jgi:dipeptidyl aminopeptidase/acylaminoacyl peptidase